MNRLGAYDDHIALAERLVRAGEKKSKQKTKEAREFNGQ